MGEVYRARDTRLERDVALKLLPAETLGDAAARARLIEEAKTASALNHPHICTIYEVGEADGKTYVAMECVEGRPLNKQIHHDGLPLELVLRYGGQIADALAYAHERGIVHRDLKSANVVITPDGRAKVLDFGLARRLAGSELSEATLSRNTLGESEEISGTLQYMAPEALRGEQTDAHSDVWSLGVVLYEMAAGRLPFGGKTSFELTSAILREPLPAMPGGVPPGLRAVIQGCLAKEPGQRYSRIGEVRSALDAIGSSETLRAAPASASGKVQRKFLAGILFAAGIVMAVVVLAFMMRGRLAGSKAGAPSETKGASVSGPRTSTGAKGSTNREANEYFERGMVYWNVQLDLQRSTQMFERALELDPKFGEARAWHAMALVGMVDWQVSNDSAWLYKAEEEAHRALADDPDSATAYLTRAVVYFYQGRKELMLAEISKALSIDPEHIEAKYWLATYHFYSGNNSQAKALCQELIATERLYIWSHVSFADILRTEGEVQAALREIEKVAEQNPVHAGVQGLLAHFYMDSGDLRRARAAFESIPRPSPFEFHTKLTGARLLAAEGKRAEALREMDDSLLKFLELNKWFTYEAAEVYAAAGETEKALEWLERAVNGSDERVEWFRRDPMLKNIRNHPRFQQILASVATRREQRAGKQEAP